MEKKQVLIVMDGVGIGAEDNGDAVSRAYTPTLDHLKKTCPTTRIRAHGTAVGLPDDTDMGNSEVGHNALGSGQIYSQGAKLVNESLKNGVLFASKCWKTLVQQVTRENSTLHFIGLLSDGNVHSHINHLMAMIKQAKEDGVRRVRIHALLDGRDVPAVSALEYIDKLEDFLALLNDENFDAAIASGGGRMKITMDRYEADWPMVELGWRTHVLGEGRLFPNARTAIETLRKETEAIDQNLPPFVISDSAAADVPNGAVKENDAVVFFNFRGDRALEISRAFEEEDFDKFERRLPENVFYAGMLEYDGDLHIPKNYLVEPPHIQHTLTEHLIKHEVKQFAISETQKYGHVTYFWNGNRLGKFDANYEDYYEVPSDNVEFNERPWMQAALITDKVLEVMESGDYGFIRLNYPNGDMVGHTGDLRAAILAVESVDLSVARIYEACKRLGYQLVVTADHGNADEMLQKDKSGELVPKTSHTLNPVPFIVYDPEGLHHFKNRSDFGLANVAATVSELLGFEADEHWEESMLED